MEAIKGTPNMMKAPMLDPSKNPELTAEDAAAAMGQAQQPPQE